jgi:hypothetical protein
LYADGLYMLAEASFKQNDFDSAIAAYRVARPVIEKSTTFSRTNFWLSSLHAAQSANKVKQYDDAKKFAQALTEDKEADPLLVLDAHLELGLAAEGLKDRELAKQSWLIAAADRGKTGIHARCLYASALFAEKKYESAILEFSLAQNGYGGDEQDPEIDPWQALATYEIGRCKYAQAVTETADTQLQRHLLNESLQDFQELIQKFPQDKLVNDAQRQIAAVKKALGELN